MSAKKRRPREQTREIILAEAHALVREEGLPEAIAFRLQDALSALGLTTGAAYNIWESQDEFRQDLASRIADTIDWAEQEVIGARLDAISDGLDFVSYSQAVGETFFEYFSERPEYYLALYFWSVKEPTQDLSDSLTEGYRVIYRTMGSLVNRVLDRFDTAIVAPYDLEAVEVAATAALEGLAIRGRVGSELSTKSDRVLFGEFFASLMQTATAAVEASAA